LVTRDRRGSAPATCQDRAGGDPGFGTARHVGGHVAIRLGAPGLATLGTRCAGPLLADVASALPRRTVSLARLRRGHLKIDLGGSSHFTAGGFSGTVASTVVLALAGRQREPKPTPTPTSARNWIATARYRITDVSGAATATVHASGMHSVCAPLDACGLHGAITLTPRRTAHPQLTFDALGNHDRSRHDLLTALGVVSGGNPRGIGIGGFGEVGSVAGRATISRSGSSCTDSLAGDAMEIDVRQRGSRLQVRATPTSMTGTDPLRSRCPGPMLGRRAFSRASLPLPILRRRQFTIMLHGTSFHDGPYAVDTRSSIAITVRRQSVTTRQFGG
jgi:hypothetical protein